MERVALRDFYGSLRATRSAFGGWGVHSAGAVVMALVLSAMLAFLLLVVILLVIFMVLVVVGGATGRRGHPDALD